MSNNPLVHGQPHGRDPGAYCDPEVCAVASQCSVLPPAVLLLHRPVIHRWDWTCKANGSFAACSGAESAATGRIPQPCASHDRDFQQLAMVGSSVLEAFAH
jgi:hypothetical protein